MIALFLIFYTYFIVFLGSFVTVVYNYYYY